MGVALVAYHEAGPHHPAVGHPDPCDGPGRAGHVSVAGLAPIAGRTSARLDRRNRHDRLLSSRPRPSRLGTESGGTRDTDIFRDVERVRLATHLDGRSSGPSRQCGYAERHLEPAPWLLVVALALAVAGRSAFYSTLLPRPRQLLVQDMAVHPAGGAYPLLF